ncbi:hypothetical protein BN1708_017599, partial [Verticillium longisporum]
QAGQPQMRQREAELVDEGPQAGDLQARRRWVDGRQGQRRQEPALPGARGFRQDGPHAGALAGAARKVLARRRDQRHLHARGRRVPDPPQGPAGLAHPRHRDGRLPARRRARGHLDQPRRARGPAPRVRHGPPPHRVGRRQPRGQLQPRARRLYHLRHRRQRRRQDPAQGRARHHAERPARRQQDGPRRDCRRRPWRHGARRPQDARGRAHRLCPGQEGRRRRSH